jgi:hypothetical protein
MNFGTETISSKKRLIASRTLLNEVKEFLPAPSIIVDGFL